MKSLPICFAIVLGLLSFSIHSAPAHSKNFWENRIPLIDKQFEEVIRLYETQDIKAAKRACDDAYFGLFEQTDANMEVAIRMESKDLSYSLESKFGEIRKMISKNESQVAIQGKIKELSSELRLAARDLDKNGVRP